VVSADLGMNDIWTGNVGATWSPDGTQLLFGASKLYPDGSRWSGLWIVNADGTDLRQFREGAFAPDWIGPG